MKYLRKWLLPNLPEVLEHKEFVEGYGESCFWYCIHCRTIYASMELIPELGRARPWRGYGGICSLCPPHKFLIRGDLTSNLIRIERDYPQEVADYLLNIEIEFLGHPEHPHNQKEA